MVPRSCMAIGLVVLLCAASGAGAGTLNFSNVTTHKVVSTTTETPSNEKAVDFGDFDQDGDLDVLIANAYSDFGARRRVGRPGLPEHGQRCVRQGRAGTAAV